MKPFRVIKEGKVGVNRYGYLHLEDWHVEGGTSEDLYNYALNKTNRIPAWLLPFVIGFILAVVIISSIK